jgi:uncharacterized protein (DUF4415 family)
MTNAKKRRAPKITDEQEARIQAGIARDPENPEWIEEDFARTIPATEFFTADQLAGLTRRRPGHRGPGKEDPKVAVKLRLDREVVDAFKADGEGWQTRINDTLRKAVSRRRTRA